VRITRALKPYVPRVFHPHYRKLKELMLRFTETPKSYQDRIQSEIDHYSGTDHVHDVPPIMNYWFSKHIAPVIQQFGFESSIGMFRDYIARICRENPEETCCVLSIGAGDSATEINIVQWLLEQGIQNVRFECLDLNMEVLDRGRRAASEKGFADRFSFSTFDINSWKPGRQYHIILAIQCLHHFVELELLFDKIYSALHPDGFFLTDDMIGRNGHQRWPEAMAFVEKFWGELPESYRYNPGRKRVDPRYENFDCSSTGFEGIRAQDILPLLLERFHFDFFFGFGNIVDIFVDRIYGPNFDPNRGWDCDFIDRVHAVDVREIESGRLKPTHMYAAMMKRPSSSPKFYKHCSPEFSVRKTTA
jgi:SAM-dependent methyltransferase